MTFWNVYLAGKLIDSVPYDDDCDADYVRRGLIGHDGYDAGIIVRRARRAGLNWRTKKDQTFQSFGCGQTHTIKFMGTCESCGRSIYSQGCAGVKPCGDRVESSPDPRGAIPPEHCMNRYEAEEYGMTGRNIVTCYRCSEDGDKYRSIIAAAKSTGAWKAVAA